MNEFIEIARIFGVPAALLAYFVWRDYMSNQYAKHREELMTARIKEVEDFQRNTIQALVVMATKSSEEVSTALRMLTKELNRRPCLKDISNGR